MPLKNSYEKNKYGLNQWLLELKVKQQTFIFGSIASETWMFWDYFGEKP